MIDHRTRLWPLAAVVAVLAAALLGACGSTLPPSPPAPSASVNPPQSATPPASVEVVSPPASEPAVTPEPTVAVECTRADVRATSTGWGGAAGSRGADVTVQNQGTAPCTLPAKPAIALFDPNGTVVLQTPPSVGGAPPTIGPSESSMFSFQVSNWCDQAVRLPLQVAVVLAVEAVPIEGVPVATVDDLPPCNGPGQPPALSATDWQAP